MTIVLHWWHLPALLIVAAILAAVFWPNERFTLFSGWGAHEFWSIWKIIVVGTCVLLAIGIVIGRAFT